ncbi:MAG: hypothetical protein A3J74_07920 [Elusimicrobia bacterium RIFCSPHIGHO2_02_FULL_57_9]|nr:MAG: hypothetical protein A3J74_07920 [Elusimicrobia bacterium RIFCSPHIGHO2_02_FULL_57_9]
MLLDSILLWWHRGKTKSKMDRVFSRGEDPFSYSRCEYELSRLAAMEKAASQHRYGRALEIGCAEGLFTEKLAGLADAVTALDISPVALERGRRRLNGRPVQFIEGDIREWSPAGQTYDLIVLGDVLYYIDKPLVRASFERVFPRITSWLNPGGRLILAHGFAGEREGAHRRGFRERFQNLGLELTHEEIVAVSSGAVRCLLSVLESAPS